MNVVPLHPGCVVRYRVHRSIWWCLGIAAVLMTLLMHGSGLPPGAALGPVRSDGPVSPFLVLPEGADSSNGGGQQHLITGLRLTTRTLEHAVTLDADTITIGPRRVGLVTFQSFPELIVVNARMEVQPRDSQHEQGGGQRRELVQATAGGHGEVQPDGDTDLLAVVSGVWNSMYTLVGQREARPMLRLDQFFRYRFPISRISIQRLTLSLPHSSHPGAELVAEDVVTMPGAEMALSFRGLRIWTTDRQVLTAPEASWQSATGLVIAGPFELSQDGRPIEATTNRFRLSTDGSLERLERAKVTPAPEAACQDEFVSEWPVAGTPVSPLGQAPLCHGGPWDATDLFSAALRPGAFSPEAMLGNLPSLMFFQLLRPTLGLSNAKP